MTPDLTTPDAYLSSKGIMFRRAGKELQLHCWNCEEFEQKRIGKLYVNSETWLWRCFRCEESGGQHAMLKHFGDAGDDWKPTPSSRRMEILDRYTDLASEALADNDAMMAWLFDRGFDEETIASARFGFVPRGVSFSKEISDDKGHPYGDDELVAAGVRTKEGRDFHGGHIVFPYLSKGRVLQVRSRDPKPGGRYYTGAGDSVRLFNQDKVLRAKKVLVCESETDCLMLQQVLSLSPHPEHRALGVVAIPGASSWPDGDKFPAMFEGVDKVFVGFDADDAGRRGAIKLKEALGTKAIIVELPQELLPDSVGNLRAADWNDYLKPLSAQNPHGGHGYQDAWDLIQKAEAAGKRIFSVGEIRREWNEQLSLGNGLKLGFAKLDDVLHPGPRPGAVIVPMAKSGEGKSQFLANVAWNVRDRRMLYITLENTATEFFDVIRRIHGFWHPTETEEDVATHLPNLRVCSENKLKKADLGHLIESYTEEVGDSPEVVVIDYLGYWANGMPGNSDYERTSAAVMLAKEVAKEQNLIIITPSQVSKDGGSGELHLNSSRDSGKVGETADFVLALWRPSRQQTSAPKKDAQGRPLAPTQVIAEAGLEDGQVQWKLLKSRRGGTGKMGRFHVSAASLVMVDPDTDRQVDTRVSDENSRINSGKKYDEIRRMDYDRAWAKAQRQLDLGQQKA